MPSFYWNIQIAQVMREQGFTDVTPANVGDQDPYWLQACMIMADINADEGLMKAREKARQRKQAKTREGKKQARAGHLHAVK